jgi:preprotein translocase subunit SecA
MTGTAYTSREEFAKVYGLDVVPIPTNKKIARIDHEDLIFQTEHGKFLATARRVKELHEKGQPVLIGTVSIEKNELLSKYLTADGIPHEVLNAKNHEREGEIIAQAGKKGAVTIATNMAGRGVDIKLGGNPTTKELADEVRALGGLAVLGTERHDARRIDNQLRGRSGRQGDPGETQFFVSLDDNLMRIFARDMVKKMMGRIGMKEDEPIANRILTRSLEAAQTKIEGLHFDARKHILEFDNVLNHQRGIVYSRRRSMLLGTSEEVKKYIEEALSEATPELKEAVEKKRNEMGDEAFFSVARQIVLQVTDMLWVENLEAMDYLRGSVNLRAYGQRDPLVEYKKEGLRMFKEMEQTAKFQVLSVIPTITNAPGGTPPHEASPIPTKGLKEIREGADEITGETKRGDESAARANDLYAGVGRNDPCPCGAKKADGTPVKYKHCHGKGK